MTATIPYVIVRPDSRSGWAMDWFNECPREFHTRESAKTWAELSQFRGYRIIKKPWKGKYHAK